VFVTIVDTRTLGVCLQRSDAHYWNPLTALWETPFNAAAHVIPFAPVDGSAFPAVISASIGSVLLQTQNCAAVILALEPVTRAVIGAIDVWTLPCPVANPATGGLVRP
jgi:hypothetical protein